MTEAQLVNTGAWIIATLVAVLIMLLAWLGNKIFQSLERMNGKIDEVSEVLHSRVTDLDRRVTRVEAHTGMDRHSFAQYGVSWPPLVGK